MAKRKDQFQPWPDTIWHTQGLSTVHRLHCTVQERLEELADDRKIVHWRTFDPGHPGSWVGMDAAWRTEDGARIRARLHMAPTGAESAILDLLPGLVSDLVGDHAMTTRWRLTAEADQPWQENWPSPLDVFFPRSGAGLRDAVTRSMLFQDATIFKDMGEIGAVADEFTQMPWYTLVCTHDRRPFESIEDVGDTPSLVSMLPASLYGRVMELRLCGDQDREINPALAGHRVQVNWGAAAILPTRPRMEGWPLADCTISRPPGATTEQMLKETAEAVIRHSRMRPHYSTAVRECVEDLRSSWELPHFEPGRQRILREKEQIEAQAVELRKKVTELQEALRVQGQETGRARQRAGELERELEQFKLSPLTVRVEEAEERAREAWAAQETAEAHADDLAAEVAWLRRERAKLPGLHYSDPAPARPEGPGSWDELIELAADLMPHVRLGDVRGPLEKLRGHTLEKQWLRRTWEGLEALEAYAAAKEEHGAAEVPHFSAYLKWPKATALISAMHYAESESAFVRRSISFAKARRFRAEGLGEVHMWAHFRIGSGRPPAPRMHLYDDTGGQTGKIHVGYIGPHLPNPKAN